jgi:hypothetical protein
VLAKKRDVVVVVVVVLVVVFVVLVVVSMFEIEIWLIHPCSWDGQSIN